MIALILAYVFAAAALLFLGWAWYDHYTFWKRYYGGKYPWWL